VPNIVVVYSESPSFFERSEVAFSRRGTEVFATQDLNEFGAIISSLPVQLAICHGIPGNLAEPALRQKLGRSPHILLLAENDVDPMVLRSYNGTPGSTVFIEPYGARALEAAQQLVAIPPRHYVRFLVQIKGGLDGPGGFGYCQNVSNTGMLLEVKRELVVDSTIRLTFLIPSSPGMVEVSARVVRHAGSLRDERRYGLHFLDLRPEDRDKIVTLGEFKPMPRAVSAAMQTRGSGLTNDRAALPALPG
jgi:hypothetical protein